MRACNKQNPIVGSQSITQQLGAFEDREDPADDRETISVFVNYTDKTQVLKPEQCTAITYSEQRLDTSADSWLYLRFTTDATLTDAQLVNKATKVDGKTTYATPLTDLFASTISGVAYTGDDKTNVTKCAKVETKVIELGEGTISAVNTSNLPADGWADSLPVKAGYTYAIRCTDSNVCYAVYIVKHGYSISYIADEDDSETTAVKENETMTSVVTSESYNFWKL